MNTSEAFGCDYLKKGCLAMSLRSISNHNHWLVARSVVFENLGGHYLEW